MSKRLVAIAALVATICFLVLGMIFKSTAEDQQGVSASTGIIVDGNFTETSTGRVGANQEKYEAFNTGGTIFFILGGITAIVSVVSFASDKHSKK